MGKMICNWTVVYPEFARIVKGFCELLAFKSWSIFSERTVRIWYTFLMSSVLYCLHTFYEVPPTSPVVKFQSSYSSWNTLTLPPPKPPTFHQLHSSGCYIG